MALKEEDTLVLLPPEEQQGDPEREGSSLKRHTFIASSISASLLCGTGLFIANIAVWCRDPKAICNDTDIFRFSVLVGGFFSSLFAGRAVDYFGRRSSLISAAVCWVVSSIFVMILPPHANIQVNPYDAPLSHALLWSSPDFSGHSSPPHDLPPSQGINTFESHVSVPHLVSYSYTQNLSHGIHTFPTEPSPVQSISIQNYNQFLNIDHKGNGNLPARILSSKNASLKYSRMDSMTGILDSHKKSSYFIPLLISHVLTGAASATSVIAASVYMCEISQTDFRARWLSLSDFFSSVFILSLPIIHDHMTMLAYLASIPIITLSLLLLIPINIPNYLFLPHSPYFILLSSLIQSKKSLSPKSDISNPNKIKHSVRLGKDGHSMASDNYFKAYGDASKGNIKFPFMSTKLKIHNVSSKSSASDSEESVCFGSDTVLEKRFEKFQPAKIENEGQVGPYQQKQSQFEDGSKVAECCEKSSFVQDKGAARSLGACVKLFDHNDECGSAMDCTGEVREEPFSDALLTDSNDIANGEENLSAVQESLCDATGSKSTWSHAESLRILSYLYGKVEGQEEWDEMNNTLKEDVNQNKHSHKNSFFNFDAVSFRTTLFLVSKIGIPLIIIHMCSCEYGVTAVLSRTILSRIGFCNFSSQATVTALQVVCAGISTLLLDKLTNQMVFTIAGIIMSTSLVTLGLLLPTVRNINNHSQPPVFIQPVTPNSALPTLYPLLPTPLPQILQRKEESICSDDLMKDSSFDSWNLDGSIPYSHPSTSSNSPFVWFAAVVLVLYVIVGSLILLPLTRFALVSSFPIGRRGIGIGVSLSLQWSIRLFSFFLPPSFFTSSLGLIFYSVISFLSVIMLSCFLSSGNQSRYSCFRKISYRKKFSHLFSYGNICNISLQNSTAV